MVTSSTGTLRPRADLDDANARSVNPADDARTILINSISWGGVLAGVVAALVTEIVLNLIGIGIGASTIDGGTGGSPSASTLSIGAGIWWAVSGMIAAFVGGYVASRLSGRPKGSTGGWHGLTTWAVSTLVVLYLLTTTLGSLVGGAFSTVSSALGGIGHTVASVAQTAAPALTQAADPVAAFQQAIQAPTSADPGSVKDAVTSLVHAMATGDEVQMKDAQDRVTQALARTQNIPVDEARARVASYEKQAQDKLAAAKREAADAAEMAASTVSHGALLGSLALLLGAVAAWFGGYAGTVEPSVMTGLLRDRRSSLPTTSE